MGLFDLGHAKRMRQLWEITNNPHNDPELHKANRKVTPPDNVILETAQTACNIAIKQVNDSINLLNTTANPETFYSRLDFLKDRLGFLARVESIDKKYIQGKPSAALKKLDQAYQEDELNMWIRYFAKCQETAMKRKTEAAQKKAMDRYFDDAAKYQHLMGAKAREFVDRNRP